jgi:hypothetical protein
VTVTGVELIIGALAAGSAAGIANTASGAISDAYTALKELLAHRMTGRAAARSALDAHEIDPGVWESRLGADLAASGAVDDAQVLAAARRLLDLVDVANAAPIHRYHVDLHMAKGVQLGNGNTQHNTFS